MYKTVLFFGCTVLTFVITVLILKKLIPILKSKKMGQHILDIGPRWHKSKEGTPTMGGLAFIISSVAVGLDAFAYLAVTNGAKTYLPLLFTLLYGAASGLIGMIDDSAKLRKAQNEGLTAPQKYLLQLITAGLYIGALAATGAVSTSLYIPYFNVTLELGIFYYIIALLLLTGVNNAVNLTDGIDGLCSSVTLVVGVFYALAAFLAPASGADNAAVIAALLIGSAAGFLVYNFYPARVFMGDTGSLFFGALVTGCAFIIGNPLIIVVAGIVYIAETASVILQVGYFKLTHGKRLFKMAPIHHHFEKCGWSELKVVGIFTLVTALACIAAWFGLA